MTELTRRDLIRSGAAGALGLWLPFATDARSATWHARAANTRVPRRALAELRRALHGRLLLPGDPGYDAASAPANFRYDSIRPIAVARCRGEADVITCVHWSRAHRVEPVARGGGHSYAGYSTTEGLLVDIGELNDVSVDHHSGRAVMAGAALNQNVLDKTVDGNFVLPGGTCLAVGVGGLTLGGGIGYNTHWAGLTAITCSPPGSSPRKDRCSHVDPKHHPRPVLGLPRRRRRQLRDQHRNSRFSCPRSLPARWPSTGSTGAEPMPRPPPCGRSTGCCSATLGASTPSRWRRPLRSARAARGRRSTCSRAASSSAHRRAGAVCAAVGRRRRRRR